MLRLILLVSTFCFIANFANARPNKCVRQLNYFIEALARRDTWSLEFLDLSAKPPAGILHGNIKQTGMFEECENFVHAADDLMKVVGKYCYVHYKSRSDGNYDVRNETKANIFSWSLLGHALHARNVELETHVCVPSACNEVDVTNFLNKNLHGSNLRVNWVKCLKKYKLKLASYDYFVVFLIAALTLIISASTYYDIKQKSDEEGKSVLLTTFSIYTNINHLLRTNNSPSPSTITCFHGLRVIAAVMVIVTHRTFYTEFKMLRPLAADDFMNEIRTRLNRCSVNFFFLMAAVLVAKNILLDLEGKRLNIVRLYIYRYLRYGPSIAFLVLLQISFLPRHLVNGPYASDMDWQTEKCQKYWWSAVTFMQTYVNPTNACFEHTWYLSSEFQLYLLTPLLMYFLWKYKWKAVGTYGSALLFKAIWESYIKYNKQISIDLYYLTHYRVSQWTIGLIIGYFINHMERSKYTIRTRLKNKVLWTGITVCYATMKFGFKIFAPESAAYYLFDSFYDQIHTILIGLLVISCHFYPSGNLVNSFLSHPLWQPLAKLTLSVYLVQTPYIQLTLANFKELQYFKGAWMAHLICGDVLACLLFGLLLYLCVEAPVNNIVEYLKKEERRSRIQKF